VSNLTNTPEKAEEQTVRFLKVYGSAPKANQYGEYKFFPQIKLFGRWLENAGFEQGQTIKISVEQGKLLIELKEEEQAPPMGEPSSVNQNGELVNADEDLPF
jgi:toxic protein SymE